ncbi:MAG: bactofilin family protein [Rhodospirillaceae bacterium]
MLRKNRSLDNMAAIAFQTLVGRNTSLEGRITFSDGIRIDGRVTGDINVERGATGSVAVGPEAEVRGNITAHRVLVAGTVFGNIHASESAHLLPTARVMGDIVYGELSVSPGAQVNGSLRDLAHGVEATERTGNLIRLADKSVDAVVHAEHRG